MQLPRAPEAVAAEEEAQQAKREQHVREEYSRDVRAVTELRRYLRKIVASLIAKSKYTDFLYPMSPEDNPEAYYKVQEPTCMVQHHNISLQCAKLCNVQKQVKHACKCDSHSASYVAATGSQPVNDCMPYLNLIVSKHSVVLQLSLSADLILFCLCTLSVTYQARCGCMICTGTAADGPGDSSSPCGPSHVPHMRPILS